MWKAREAYAILDLWCSFPVINCPFNGKHKCIASQSIIGRGWLQVTDTLGELLIDYREEREREKTPGQATSIAESCSTVRFLII